MTTTPPPGASSRLRSPPTPLHGAKYDDYEPYSPRRSSRIRAKEHIDQIVSATKPTLKNTPTLHPSPRKPLARQESLQSTQTLSPPSSPVSPARRGQSPTRALFKHGMLPTPAKTPSKRDEKYGSGRLLFASRGANPQDVMPSPRRSRPTKRFTLDDEPDNERIQVYTDSVDCIPEVDEDADNPFIVRKSPRKTKISSFTQRLSDATSGKTKYGMSREIDAAVDNDEGMVYTFRGRKVFRKFNETPDALNASELSDPDPLIIDEDNATHRAGFSARQHLTRRSIQPRLLFPARDPSPNPNDTDEDAPTDVDELAMDMDMDVDHAPEPESEDDLDELAHDTPIAATPRKQQTHMVMPVTPPTTVRKTRHSVGHALTPDASPKKSDDVVAKGARLFDSWQRTKPGAATGRSQSLKRGGEEMVRDGQDTKRTRSAPRSAPRGRVL